MLISLKFSVSFHGGRECGQCVHLERLMFSILCCLVQTVLLMAVMMIRETSSDRTNDTDTTNNKGRLSLHLVDVERCWKVE